MSALRFRVWTPSPCWFVTLAEASAHAEAYRKRTGVFVAITEHPIRRT